MVEIQNLLPREQGSFPVKCDGNNPEELMEAGKYDWVADYSRQIIHAKAASVVNETEAEIVLLGSLPQREQLKLQWSVSMSPDINLEGVFGKYGRPNVWDVLRFGALYPDEQRKADLIFPHEPWNGSHGQAFVLVLRTDPSGARGLSYVTHSGTLLGNWCPWPLVAVRKRRGGPPLSVVS